MYDVFIPLTNANVWDGIFCVEPQKSHCHVWFRESWTRGEFRKASERKWTFDWFSQIGEDFIRFSTLHKATPFFHVLGITTKDLFSTQREKASESTTRTQSFCAWWCVYRIIHNRRALSLRMHAGKSLYRSVAQCYHGCKKKSLTFITSFPLN